MAHYKFRNVNDAFRTLVKDIHDGVLPTEVQPSRYGEVVRVTEPVIVTYSHPWECVLLNRARDANPFFAMYEALWMLVGRNDVAPLAYYNRRMREFSDDGVRFNGAYGYRWRHATLAEPKTAYAEVNQLDVIVKHLKDKPESRRAVLQMWTVEDDLLKIDTSKDVCCLSGDTKFRSPEGDTTIANLASRFQSNTEFKFPVYTVDIATGNQRIDWMTNAWRVGVRVLYEVRFDDGSRVKMTGDHTVFRKRKVFDGKRCIGLSVEEAQVSDINVGDHLIATLAQDSSSRVSPGGYRQFKKNIYTNTRGSNMGFEHRHYIKLFEPLRAGHSIHHRNGNKLDNHRSNLRQILNSEHFRIDKEGSKNPHKQMSREARKRRGMIHSAVLRCGGKAKIPGNISSILDIRPPRRTSEQKEMLMDWASSFSNHKVITISKIGANQVYDFTVPGRHNAVLSNGLLVHNCNLNVCFDVGRGVCGFCRGGICSNPCEVHPCPACEGKPHDVPCYLNMTVFNRSNDLVWGMLGANAVQFPFLQAYMAGRLGLDVGVYHQVTNNLHAYTKNWKPLEWLAEPEEEYPGIGMSLIRDAMVFEEELPVFVDEFSGGVIDTSDVGYLEPFLEETAFRMCLAHYCYKNVDYGRALSYVDEVKNPDWREAGRRWLERRIAKRSKA